MKEFFNRGQHDETHWYSEDLVSGGTYWYDTKEEFDAGEQREIELLLNWIERLKVDGFYPVDAPPDIELLREADARWFEQPHIIAQLDAMPVGEDDE